MSSETVRIELDLSTDEQKALRHEFSEPYGRDIRIGVLGKLRAALDQPDSTERVEGLWLQLLKDWCAEEAKVAAGERREAFQRVELRLATLTGGKPTHADIDWATAATSPEPKDTAPEAVEKAAKRLYEEVHGGEQDFAWEDISDRARGEYREKVEAEDTAPEVTVEQIWERAVKWAEHHRNEEEAHAGVDPATEEQHRAVAEAFEDIVRFIDHPPDPRLPHMVRALKTAHGGRHHG